MNTNKILLAVAIILFLIGVFCVFSSYQLAIWDNTSWDIGATSLGVSLIGVSIGFLALYISLESGRRMNAMANLEYYEKMAVIENYITDIKSGKELRVGSLKYDIVSAHQLNKFVDKIIEQELDRKINELKSEVNKNEKYKNLINELWNWYKSSNFIYK